jgi:hypothetical protein
MCGVLMTNSLANSQVQPLHFSRGTKRTHTIQTLAETPEIDFIKNDADCCGLCLMAAKIVPRTGIVAVCDVSLSRSSLRCAATMRRHAYIELHTTTEHSSITLAVQLGNFCLITQF